MIESSKSERRGEGLSPWAARACLVPVLLAWGLAAFLATGAAGCLGPGAHARSGDGRSDTASLFGTDRVWAFHLIVDPDQWAAMEPKPIHERDLLRRGLHMLARLLGPGRGSGEPRRGPPGGVRYDFPYVEADLVFDGRTYPRVGLRYKGNSSFRESAGSAKRPLKIDLNRFVPGQTLRGAVKLNLSNNWLDPDYIREALSYELFRAAGVAAPRTASARVFLTVQGRYDREYLGLYTVVEQVDKRFLRSRFGDGKGLLLKPEGVQGIGYLGEEWEAYEEPYDPKSDVTVEQARRFIEFAKFVETSDDEAFAAYIDSWMDLRSFARFLAVNVLLANADSFLGMSRNYYLYLHPESRRFLWIPWDLDLSFGLHRMLGAMEDQMNLSIARPYVGRNNVLMRLLALERFQELYRAQLIELSSTVFRPERVLGRIDALKETLEPVLEEEPKRAGLARGPGKPSRPDRWGEIPLREFFTGRMRSVAAQLSGQAEGVALRRGPPRPR